MPGESLDLEKLCNERWDEIVRILLKTPHWPTGIELNKRYGRFDDDTRLGAVIVTFSPDLDAWFDVISEDDPEEPFGHRFRVPVMGGGESERVRMAMLILALAIKLDNEERPQRR